MDLGNPENQDAKDYILAINTEDFTYTEARDGGAEGSGREREGSQVYHGSRLNGRKKR